MDFYEIMLQQKLAGGGGGGDISVESLSVTENGTYSASSGYAYSPVNVSVPTGVFPSGTSSITSNGIYDVTNFESADVNVPGIVPSGTSSITANGIYDITNFASVDVNVSGGGGGGITVDDIAERTISGAISGNASFIGSAAFSACTNLTSVYFPSAKAIHNSAFINCYNLANADFPVLQSIYFSAFAKNIKLESISIPNVSVISTGAFAECSKLTTIVLPKITKIYSYAFNWCELLDNVTILASSVAALSNSNAFAYTKINSGTGSIYVPASLVDSYKAAANWSYLADRITSIPE